MTDTSLVPSVAFPLLAESCAAALESALELRRGQPAKWIDVHLRRAARGRGLSNRILAFYLDELEQSGKCQDLGYRCVAQYAVQRLRLDARRARELSCAGRALASLRRIDDAFLDGRLTWTETELLTHGIQEHEQDEWIERAGRVSCAELKQMLRRHSNGLRVEKEREGGLPRAEFALCATLQLAAHDRLEAIRQDLMRVRGCLVDDSEVIAYVLDKHELPERDAVEEATRQASAEGSVTPDWLRRRVLARDHHRCQACGAGQSLHVHHIVFRSEGGLTREDNLVTTCVACHGLIHTGRLFARRGAGSGAGVEFLDRDGVPLVGPSSSIGVTRRVLDVLRGRGEGGGQPPLSGEAVGATGSAADLTSEWFLAHMDELEPGRDGVWRFKESGSRLRTRR